MHSLWAYTYIVYRSWMCVCQRVTPCCPLRIRTCPPVPGSRYINETLFCPWPLLQQKPRKIILIISSAVLICNTLNGACRLVAIIETTILVPCHIVTLLFCNSFEGWTCVNEIYDARSSNELQRLYLTHSSRDKMAAISRRHYQMHFRESLCMNLD